MSVAARRWLVGGAVAVLAVGAVCLTVLALQHVQAAPNDRKVAPVPTFSQPVATPTAQPTPSEIPDPDVQGPSYDRSQERFLAVGDGVVWRGVAGACGAVAPLLERSTDGGDTWTDVTPEYLDIGQLSALDAFAGDQSEIIASMGDDCEVQALRTFTQGQFWESYDDVLALSRYIEAADASSVALVGDMVEAPCTDARGLRASVSTVALICDATAYTLTADATWQALPASGVAALAVDGSDVIVAHIADGCAGLTVTRYTEADDARAEDAGCFADADMAAPTALAADGNEVLAWSGDGWFKMTG